VIFAEMKTGFQTGMNDRRNAQTRHVRIYWKTSKLLPLKKEEEVVVVEQPKKIIGLKLIYQKTSDEIQLKTEPKIILGRQNFGSKVLSKIKQVSRAHCSIEFADNQFIVKDLGSTNGTFTGLGDDKVNCLEPQILKDKDFLVLGQEVFLVQLLKEEDN
jgi:pSer/pThr/pTyr-binding forkhead associated (FHA) protein